MRNIIKGLLILLLIFIMGSCGDKQGNQISAVIPMAGNKPDSTIAILNKIDQARLSDKDLALYSLVYTMAQDKSGLDIDNDSLIRCAYDWYKDKSDDSLFAKCEYYMGKYYMLNDSDEAAISCFYIAQKYAHLNKDNELECLALEKLSKILRQTDPYKALFYARKAISTYSKVRNQRFSNKAYYILNMCECLSYTDSTNTAISLCNQLHPIAKSKKEGLVVSDIYQTLSVLYEINCETKSSLYCSRNSVLWDGKIDNSKTFSLVSAYLNADSIKLAEHYLRKITPKTNLDKYTSYYYWSKILIKDEKINLSEAMADSAYLYLEKMYSDAAEAKTEYYNQAINKERSISLIRATSIKRQAFLSVIAIMLLCCSIVTLYRFKSYKKRKLLEKQMTEKIYSEKISHQNIQIATMHNYLMSKIDIVRKLNVRNGAIKKKILLTDEDWKELKEFMDSTDDLFVSRLTKQYPSLTENDVKLMILLRLKVNQKDLADIYGISEKAIKQKLFLYKSKVGIEGTKQSLREFIEAF